jgi:hypothetical protein
MSLILSESEPHVEVKTHGMFERDVFITVEAPKGAEQDHENLTSLMAELTMADFVEMVKYVMTNTNLRKDDPRLDLVKWTKRLKKIKGYGDEGKRLSDA